MMADREVGKEQSELAGKIRELFYAKYSDNLTNRKYDERDVERFEKDDKYVTSFYRDLETVQIAVDRIHETFKFRLDLGVNDLQEDSFPADYFEKGAVFIHNTDKDGHKILYLLVRKHKREPALFKEVKRFVAYFVEEEYRKNPDGQLVVLFDLMDAGVSNIDLDFIKFVLTLFKDYYPQKLAYLLIFEMPWLFSAAWKIIKSWLSPEVLKRIKFVTRNDIQAYIDKDKVLESMGGTDKFVFKFEPRVETAEEHTETSAKQKRVTFAEHEAGMYKSLSNDSIQEQDCRPKSGILGKSKSSTSRRVSRDNTFIGHLLTVSPAEELEFVMEEGGKEAMDTITLKNTLPYSIAYKVKTTSPEKYRVRPSSGIVKAGSQVEVMVHLQQAYQNTVHKDKFLIMAMEIRDESSESTTNMWKSVQRDSIMEHRLRCVVSSGHGGGDKAFSSSQSSQLPDLHQKVEELTSRTNRLHRSVKIMMTFQALSLIFMLYAAYLMFNNGEPDSGICQAPGLQV